ncbi:bifunctional lysylphosphatidylglycerol flippase/synthetase MprF [Mammaliicoccus fleurettii]|uniref:Phosphatidylglycerol lysyltransferase n=1 Tax=Mammaliicoccus fleurettii TaxID=150056 RepID=A0ABS5MQ49_9STAP|nr:bifunctional lysylphosphatidylglycerol flippase/synthetase MprF [Mammaliicoccus fleurettii]MBL0848399.1 bifunctional lysylphosphatidylglycerol flippase/synthetase MprF [Mammaliicoccus fleurettii]MBS3672924.1 bifunctional lysylphosphatidylglycerol flippase/synthetase MprF [Mammaliicoccus fleurettii]MBS3698007.1 bifunctional lysylphosphatidylglycerol flippase/synthetase MprF [Mammaliicoccus fleurettii]
MNILKRKKIFSLVKLLFICTILCVVIYVLHNEIGKIDFKKTIVLFREMNTAYFVGIILLGVLSVSVLSLYDIMLKQSLKISLPIHKILSISYIINTFNSILGFGGLIGAGLRIYSYRNDVNDKKELIKSVSLLLLSMLSGLSLLCVLIVLGIFNADTLLANIYWAKIVLYIGSLFLPLFIIFSFLKPSIRRDRFLGVKFTIVSALEWLAASFLLFIILKALHINIDYAHLVGIFVIAALSGLISMIPGGFGAFDLVILLGIKSLGVPEEQVLLALLLYRVAYYFFPFIIALGLSTIEFGGIAKKYIEESKFYTPAMDTTSFIKSVQSDFMAKIPSLSLGLLSGITGFVLYFNHILILYDAIYSHHFMFYSIILALHTASTLMLLICAKGVMSGTMRSTLMSIISVIVMLIVCILSNSTIIAFLWLAILLVLLFIGYKKAIVVKKNMTPIKIVLSGILIFTMFIFNRIVSVNYLNLYPHEVTKFDKYAVFTMFWIVLAILCLLGVCITFMLSKKYQKSVSTNSSYETINNIINNHEGSYVSHLAFTGDKSFFVNKDEDVFIMYRYTMNAVIVLGDPIGNKDKFNETLNDFYDQMYFLGYDIIFYQVQSKLLSLYHDYGNVFFKLGEEALIDLNGFSLSGKKKRGMRATYNKLESESYQFEIINTPYSEEDIKMLQTISDSWLGEKKEMNFSVGAFNLDYLNKAPIAVIRNVSNEIVGFCTLMYTNYNQSVSIDLIRWNKDIDISMMDALYIHMLLWAKEEGYKQFNMGMATLSNVGLNKHAYLREKFAAKVFENMNSLYSFQGLRNYKQKYAPDWEPRYLVYRKYSSLLWNLVRVSLTINHK